MLKSAKLNIHRTKMKLLWCSIIFKEIVQNSNLLLVFLIIYYNACKFVYSIFGDRLYRTINTEETILYPQICV